MTLKVRAKVMSSYALVLLCAVVLMVLAASLVYYIRWQADISIYSLRVTNVTPTSASIVWRTENPSVGTIALMSRDTMRTRDYVSAFFNKNVYFDTRELEQNDDGVYVRERKAPYYVHHVTVTGLDPEEEYAFVIMNNGIPADQQAFDSFLTPFTSDTVNRPAPVYGAVIGQNIDLDDAVLVAEVEQSKTLELNKRRSAPVSITLAQGSYVVDVANLYRSDFQEVFPSLIDEPDTYVLRVTIITAEGEIEREVADGKYQPVNTIRVFAAEAEAAGSVLSKIATPAYAVCRSQCVGDCQGCNKDTPGEPLCATYGCGYMSHCCGYGNACFKHCTNGKKDLDCKETGIDCGGGGCATCGDEGTQTTSECPVCVEYGGGDCVAANPETGDCKCSINDMQDSDEKGIDCGGNYCPTCKNGGAHCYNKIQDQDEDGVDCGGKCAVVCAGPNEPAEEGVLGFGDACSNDGVVFTCQDRPDWDCVCWAGSVSYFQKKSGGDVGSSEEDPDVDQETGFDNEPAAGGGGGGGGGGGAVASGSGSCTGAGTAHTTSDGKFCCSGTCLEVCTWNENGVQKSAVKFVDNPPGVCPEQVTHNWMSWDEVGASWDQSLFQGEWDTQDSDWMCFYQQEGSYSRELSHSPEHETMCVHAGGGNVGVGGGNGELRKTFVSSAFAQTDEVEPGVYSVTSTTYDITTKSIEVLETGKIRYFYDANQNGTLDAGESFMTDDEANAIEIELQKETDLMTYTFEPGWNSISVPLVMTEDGTSQVTTASELLTYFRGRDLQAYHIATYREHEFLIYSQRTDTDGNPKEYGTDFGLLPGEGYFVKSANGGDVPLMGFAPEASLPVVLKDGWNLVGFYKNGTTTWDALALIDDIQDADIPADILSKWESGRYVSVISDGAEYGIDFKVFPNAGYWVRVQSGVPDAKSTYTP